ncbi:hypothetical protein ACROYT_G041794 [Oculina patagonica]
MASNMLRVVLFVLLFIQQFCNGADPQPEQIHISATGDPTEMMVTWVTLAFTNYSIVEYNKVGFPLTLRASGGVTKFTDGGPAHRVLFIHRVKLTGLVPGQRYDYHVGGYDGWSELFAFNALKSGEDWSPRIALYGDLGSVNAKSIAFLQQEAQEGKYDAFLHIGDFAYNMEYNNGLVGDDFMNQIQTIAAYVPYMTCPGNHEQAYNFSNYKKRFSMPGNTEGIFYSWNIGPAHIISFSTEVYYWLNYGIEQIVQQYEWLIKDLQEAASPENRRLRPWIITMGHKPMYCDNDDGDYCKLTNRVIRKGITSKHLFGLEDLFYKYGVDVTLWAHEHSYERLWPLYNMQVCNGSWEEPYTNPCAPVHIITGSAGCTSKHDPFLKDKAPWTAYRTEHYGYTRMTIHSKTEISIEQVDVDLGGQVVDKMTLIKDIHGPEAWTRKNVKN